MPKSIIKRSDLSGSSIRIIVDTSLEYVVDIAIDSIHNKIFWVDQLLKTVETASFDGTDRDILFHSPVSKIFLLMCLVNFYKDTFPLLVGEDNVLNKTVAKWCCN